jgi:glucose/arabinose dehydrogenase
VDRLAEPVPNPWNADTFFGGFDFFSDGRAAVCTMQGEVWIVSGIDDSLKHLSWRRFASGIFQGLGLRIVNDQIYVLGRDQITRLHDLNGDGEADFYENFNNDTILSANPAEYCLDLQTDSTGSFFFGKAAPWLPDTTTPHQGVLFHVSPDGSRSEVYATGLRAQNGMAIGPHDEITISDNQGHWMPACKLNLIQRGGFYGMVPTAQRELERDQFPRQPERSTGARGA